MKKKDKRALESGIVAKTDVPGVRRGVTKQKVLWVAAVSVLVGFILGATVAILRTPKETKEITTTGPSQKEDQTDYEEAIRLAQSVLEKDPRNLEALIALGNAYFDTDRYQEAIDAYSRALAIDPKNADVRTDMGIMYRRLGQFDKALEAFRQAALDQPLHVNSRFNLGVVLKYDKKDYQGAIEAWEDFLRLEAILDPDDQRPTMVRQEIESMKASLTRK